MVELLRAKPVRMQETPAFSEAKSLFLADVEKTGKPKPAASASDLGGKRELVEKALKIAGKSPLLANTYNQAQLEALVSSARMLAYLDSFEQAREFSKLGEGGTKRVLILAEPETAKPGVAIHDAAASLEGGNKVSLVLINPTVSTEAILKTLHPDVVFFLPDSVREGSVVRQIAALFTIGQKGTCIEISPEKPWEFTATRKK